MGGTACDGSRPITKPMINPDYGNSFFELVGAYFTWSNARALYRDREIKGVYWPTTVFFTAWGIWNIYYYAALDQWLSWGAGLILVLGNVAWTTMAIKLYWKNRSKQ